MRIVRERGGRLLMAELRGDGGDRRAGREQVRGEGVTQIVEAVVRQASDALYRLEALGHSGQIKRRARLGREDPRREVSASHGRLGLGVRLPECQRFDKPRCEIDVATLARLRPPDGSAGYRALDGQCRHAPRFPALDSLRSWLNSWPGIGAIAVGMARQGFDLQLTRYDAQGWRATFYVTGMEHSATSATGSAWERAPWQATQWAAWEVLSKEDAR